MEPYKPYKPYKSYKPIKVVELASRERDRVTLFGDGRLQLSYLDSACLRLGTRHAVGIKWDITERIAIETKI